MVKKGSRDADQVVKGVTEGLLEALSEHRERSGERWGSFGESVRSWDALGWSDGGGVGREFFGGGSLLGSGFGGESTVVGTTFRFAFGSGF